MFFYQSVFFSSCFLLQFSLNSWNLVFLAARSSHFEEKEPRIGFYSMSLGMIVVGAFLFTTFFSIIFLLPTKKSMNWDSPESVPGGDQ